METYCTPVQGTKGRRHSKPDLHDRQGKDHDQGKMADQRISHIHHSHNHPHPHSHPAWSQDNHGCTHSASDVSSVNKHHHGHKSQNHHHDKCHSSPLDHRHHHRSAPRQLDTDVTPRPQTSASSSSSFSGSSSSSTFTSSSTSSSSWSSSGSSSSWSSQSSVNESVTDKNHLLQKPRFSQSCTDISKGRNTYNEDDEDDTCPLIDDESHLYRSPSQEKGFKGKKKLKSVSSYQPAIVNTLTKQKSVKNAGMAGKVRKAKSMEALSRCEERNPDADTTVDMETLKNKKEVAKKDLLKEKLKFSAFLNEITRQVLSPYRLTYLGVTSSHRPTSPVQASLRSPKVERKDEERQSKKSIRPGSASSMTSSVQSNISRQCGSISHSLSHLGKQQHDRPHQPAKAQSSSSHSNCSTSPGNCPPSSRHPSRSLTPIHHQHHSHSLSHHHHHGRVHSPYPHRGDHHNSIHHRGDHHSPKRHHRGHRDPTHHHHHGDLHNSTHHHNPTHHQHSPSHPYKVRYHHSPTPSQHHRDHISLTPPNHHGDPYSQTQFQNYSGLNISKHPHGEPQNPTLSHGEQHSQSHSYHYGDNHSPKHCHNDHHSPSYPNYSHHCGDQHSPNHNHQDHHDPTYQPYHREHHNTTHHHEDDHSPSHLHRHRDHYSPTYPHHHRHSHSPTYLHSDESHCQPLRPDFLHHHNTSYPESYHHHGSQSESIHQHGTQSESLHHGSQSESHHHHGSQSESLDHHGSHPESYHHSSHPESHYHHGSHPESLHHHGSQSDSLHQHGSHPESHHHHGSQSESHHHHGSHPESHHHHGSHPESLHHHSSQSESLHHQNVQSESHHHHGSHSESHHHHDYHPESHHHQDSQPDSHHHHDSHPESHHHHDSHPEPHHQHGFQSESHHAHSHSEAHILPNTESLHHHHHHSSLVDFQHHPSHNDHQHPHRESNDSLSSHSKENSPLSVSATELESLTHSSKSVSSTSPTNPEKQMGCNLSTTSLQQEGLEMDRIMMLQEQNEDLHHSLLQTAVRMECMGAEFKSSHQLLESELQNTRVELSSLLDKFKRLTDNYSYSQQTNNLLERKLHSVVRQQHFTDNQTWAQSLDGEREHLNQRITALTEQLSSAKTTLHSMETINVTSLLQEALDKHFHPNDLVNPFPAPAAPPPVQFMDSNHYGKVTATGDDQLLGTLPEEEESDWSEMGDDSPQCVLRFGVGVHGGTAFHPWRQERGRWAGPGEGDTESESGGEEVVRRHPPGSLLIPQLHVSVHSGTLAASVDKGTLGASSKSSAEGPGGQDRSKVPASRKLGSPVRILSASLGEIPSSRSQQHRQEGERHQLRGTEAMMDLHHPDDASTGDSEDEILRNWSENTGEDKGTDATGADPDGSLDNLQSAQNMLNHFICQLQPGQVRGWTGGVPEDVLNRDRTQL